MSFWKKKLILKEKTQVFSLENLCIVLGKTKFLDPKNLLVKKNLGLKKSSKEILF